MPGPGKKRKTELKSMSLRRISSQLGLSGRVKNRRTAFCEMLRVIIAGICLSSLFAQQAPPTSALLGSISGRVIDVTTGSPIAGIEVMYRKTDGPPQASSVKADDEGRYHIPNLAAGSYGFFGVSPISGYSSSNRLVILASGEDLRDVDFKATKAAVISGRVLDPDKRPLQGATIQARSFFYRDGRLASGFRGAKTNDLGEYRMAMVPPGSYFLMVEQKPLTIRKRAAGQAETEAMPEPVLALARTWYPNSAEHEGAMAVTLAPGDQRDSVDIVLIREKTVCVRVRLRDSAGGPSTTIRAQVVENVPGGMSTVADGNLRSGDEAEVCGIPPGSYHFRAVTRDDSGEERYVAEPFHVTNSAIRLPELQLSALPTIKASLKLEGGDKEPKLQAPVLVGTSVADFGTIVMSAGYARVQEPGAFLIPGVRPEEIWLSVRPPDGAYLKSATINGIDAMRRSFRALDGDLQIVLGLDGPIVSGEVVDKDGKPVPDAGVLFGLDPLPTSFAPNELLQRQTDQNGRFTLKGMAPGKFRVLVFPEYGTHLTDPAFFRANRLKGEAVTLSSGENRSLRCVLKD